MIEYLEWINKIKQLMASVAAGLKYNECEHADAFVTFMISFVRYVCVCVCCFYFLYKSWIFLVNRIEKIAWKKNCIDFLAISSEFRRQSVRSHAIAVCWIEFCEIKMWKTMNRTPHTPTHTPDTLSTEKLSFLFEWKCNVPSFTSAEYVRVWFTLNNRSNRQNNNEWQ